jgi:disease resistance protein RPM1
VDSGRVCEGRKREDFGRINFCKHISEDGLSSLSGIIRRLSITTISNDIVACFGSSHVRSLLVFTNNMSVIHWLKIIPTRYRLLKVLDYQDSYMFYVPDSLGSLIHLNKT